MYKKFKISAILLLGGSGSRFESTLPKQFHILSGKKIYLHTLENFLKLNIFDEIILSCHKEWIDDVQKDTSHISNLQIIQGGKTRQESSYLALMACNSTDYVVIHDAVRPFVSDEIILKNIEKVIQFKAVDTCIKSSDTIVHSKNNDKILDIPLRDNFLRGQTPQSFDHSLILKAHKQAIKNNLTNISDDCRLVLNDHDVFIVDGSEHNIKITTQLDLFVAEQLFRLKKTTVSSKNISLENKTFALIGASGGIGSKIFELLEKEKAKVLPISRTSEYKADLLDYNSLKKVFDRIYKEHGQIDGLINSAGLFIVKSLKKMSQKEIEDLIVTNLTSLIHSCKMIKLKKGSHIINISSSSFTKGRKNYGVYSATKAAIVNFSQSLAEEFENLKVNIIVPSRTNTSMRTKYFPNEDKTLLLDPIQIAKTVIDVLKNDITGTLVEVKNNIDSH